MKSLKIKLPLVLILCGLIGSCGFLVFLKPAEGPTGQYVAKVVVLCLLGAAGTAFVLLGIALLSYKASLRIGESTVEFTRTLFWQTRHILFGKSELEYVFAAFPKHEATGGRSGGVVQRYLHTCLHFSGPTGKKLGNLSVHRSPYHVGIPTLRDPALTYAAAMKDVLQKAEEISLALGIEHRANLWEGELPKWLRAVRQWSGLGDEEEGMQEEGRDK